LLYYVLGLLVREVADEMSTPVVPVRPGTVRGCTGGRIELDKALSNEETEDV
jgi:hypothetical protein